VSDVEYAVDGAVGRIMLNREHHMNAITAALADQLRAALQKLGSQHDVHVIVIRGTGGNFCAGGDFDEVTRLRNEGPSQLRTLFAGFHAACNTIAQLDVPVIAAVEGVAMAGGFELMQAADIVLVRDDARISDNHINFGMIPGGGSTARLSRIVGRQTALSLLLSGERLSGVDAVSRGLAYRSFPAPEFEDGVEKFLAALAGRDRSAVAQIKRLVLDGIGQPIEHALSDETDAVVARLCGQAGKDGISAFNNREVRT
jgi:enoyl-CoA hydratase/carnithine racemase